MEQVLRALRVTRAVDAAEGIRLFELRDPDGAALPAFTAGAHVAVRVPGGAMRSYSLCGDPARRDRYLLAVKREASGRGGSAGLVDGLRAGDTLEVGEPANLFALVEAPAYIFVAGGIGITPILAMIHHVGSRVPFHLYYLTRSPATTAFLAELAAPELAGHVTIHHDGGEPDAAFDLWPVFEAPSKAHVYCCGPRPLMDAVRDMTGHWPGSAVHFEDFGAGLAAARADDTAFTLRLARSGVEVTVSPGTTALEALRAQGVAIASSCESGTCGTCRVTVLAGEPDHRDMVLSPAERAHEMMVCVSRARSPVVVVDV